MAMIRLALLLMCFGCNAEQIIYVFGDSPEAFSQGPLTKRALSSGVTIKHFEPGSQKREKIELFLSEGLGGNPEEAQKILSEKIKNNQWAIDELMDAVTGEQLILQHKIESYPAILIDGALFYTSSIDTALRRLKNE